MYNPTYNHKEMKARVGPSNLKMLDGEDLTGGDRRRLQQMQMNDWIRQQTNEHDEKKRQQKQAQQDYDQHAKEVNDMVIALNDEQRKRHIQMEIANQQTNLQLMQEKLDREEFEAQQAQLEKQQHLKNILEHDLWTENTSTCQSGLAQHRVLPYHYKGMSNDQRDAIREEQERQRKENEEKKRRQKEDEIMWSLYNEHNRKMLINMEREKSRKLKELQNNTKEFNLLLQEEQKIKLKNQYA